MFEACASQRQSILHLCASNTSGRSIFNKLKPDNTQASIPIPCMPKKCMTDRPNIASTYV